MDVLNMDDDFLKIDDAFAKTGLEDTLFNMPPPDDSPIGVDMLTVESTPMWLKTAARTSLSPHSTVLPLGSISAAATNSKRPAAAPDDTPVWLKRASKAMNLDGERSIAVGIYQRDGANALSVSQEVLSALKRLESNFPPGGRSTCPTV